MVITFDIDHVVVLGYIIDWLHEHLFKDFMVIRSYRLPNPVSSFPVVESSVKVIESDHHGCDVVAASSHSTCLQDRIHSEACQSVAALIVSLALLLASDLLFIDRVDQRVGADLLHQASLPDQVNTVPILKLVEDSVAADHDEIVLLTIDPKRGHVWISDHNLVVSIKSR